MMVMSNNWKKPATLGVICLGAILVLAGCGGGWQQRAKQAWAKSTSNTASAATTASAGTPFDKVVKLLDQGRPRQASKAFDAEQHYFGERRQDKKVVALRQRLVTALHASYDAQFGRLARALESTQWPAPPGRWPGIAGTLHDAGQVTPPCREHMVLCANAPVSLDRMKKAKADLERRIKASAGQMYTKYAATLDRDFANIYPVKVTMAEISRQAPEVFRKVVRNLDAGGIARYAKQHAADLNFENKQVLAERYFDQLMADPARRQRGFRGLLETLGKLHEAKLPPPDKTRGMAVVIIVNAPDSDFPIALDLQPGNFPLLQFIEMPTTPPREAKDADYVVVLSDATAEAKTKIRDRETVDSDFVAATRQVVNPDYIRAQDKLYQAQRKLRRAEAGAIAAQNCNYCPSSTGLALGSLVGQIIGTREVDKLQKELDNTPMYIEQPIYQTYEFERGTVAATRTVTLAYRIFDRQRRVMERGAMKFGEKRDFKMIAGLKKNDRNYYRHNSGMTKEADVEKWLLAPFTLNDEMLVRTHLAGRPVEVSKVRSVAAAFKRLALPAPVASRDGARSRGGVDNREVSVSPRFDALFHSVVQVTHGSGMGSGFAISENLIVSNEHVVDDHKLVTIKFRDGRKITGRVLAADARRDIAIIRISGGGVPAALHRGPVPIGGEVIALGHPEGFNYSITRGIVSAVRRFKGGDKAGVLQVQSDVAMNHGNSGGPMFLGGRVVGVNSWGQKDTTGLNFAIHIDEVRALLDENNINW